MLEQGDKYEYTTKELESGNGTDSEHGQIDDSDSETNADQQKAAGTMVEDELVEEPAEKEQDAESDDDKEQHGNARQGRRHRRKSTPVPDQLRLRMKKTKFCRWVSQGKCERGNACFFAHSKSELRALPDLRLTRMCLKFEQSGTCTAGSRCRFAHSEEELRCVEEALAETSPETSTLINQILSSRLPETAAKNGDDLPNIQAEEKGELKVHASSCSSASGRLSVDGYDKIYATARSGCSSSSSAAAREEDDSSDEFTVKHKDTNSQRADSEHNIQISMGSVYTVSQSTIASTTKSCSNDIGTLDMVALSDRSSLSNNMRGGFLPSYSPVENILEDDHPLYSTILALSHDDDVQISKCVDEPTTVGGTSATGLSFGVSAADDTENYFPPILVNNVSQCIPMSNYNSSVGTEFNEEYSTDRNKPLPFKLDDIKLDDISAMSSTVSGFMTSANYNNSSSPMIRSTPQISRCPSGPIIRPSGPIIRPSGPIIRPSGPIIRPSDPTSLISHQIHPNAINYRDDTPCAQQPPQNPYSAIQNNSLNVITIHDHRERHPAPPPPSQNTYLAQNHDEQQQLKLLLDSATAPNLKDTPASNPQNYYYRNWIDCTNNGDTKRPTDAYGCSTDTLPSAFVLESNSLGHGSDDLASQNGFPGTDIAVCPSDKSSLDYWMMQVVEELASSLPEAAISELLGGNSSMLFGENMDGPSELHRQQYDITSQPQG